MSQKSEASPGAGPCCRPHKLPWPRGSPKGWWNFWCKKSMMNQEEPVDKNEWLMYIEVEKDCDIPKFECRKFFVI